MKLLFLLIFLLPLTTFSYDPTTGVSASIILSDPSKALIVFDHPVTTRIGNKYPTDVPGLEFEVVEISPLKTRVIGRFNKISGVRPDRVFVYGIASKDKLNRKVVTNVVQQAPVVAVVQQPIQQIVKVEEKDDSQWWNFGVEKFSFSMFYTFSFGSFYERINNVSAESSQNSPFTLGASVNFNINNNFSYSGSTYWSLLNAALPTSQEVSISNEVADIPWEYGFTSYIEYIGFKYALKPYFGFDLESFSTFNTDEIAINQNVAVEARTHSFVYATLGVSLFTKAFNRPFLIKSSFSTNFTSSSSRPSTQSNEDFNGQKFIVFFASKIKGNWGGSFMYKRHMMEGPTDLTISRYGFGVSYRFR